VVEISTSESDLTNGEYLKLEILESTDIVTDQTTTTLRLTETIIKTQLDKYVTDEEKEAEEEEEEEEDEDLSADEIAYLEAVEWSYDQVEEYGPLVALILLGGIVLISLIRMK
jgi:hypothetical protein